MWRMQVSLHCDRPHTTMMHSSAGSNRLRTLLLLHEALHIAPGLKQPCRDRLRAVRVVLFAVRALG